LNLDDDVAAQFFRHCEGCIRARRSAASRDLESIGGENRFALIFVKSRHCWLLFHDPNQISIEAVDRIDRQWWS
jgi:hypothetical protein